MKSRPFSARELWTCALREAQLRAIVYVKRAESGRLAPSQIREIAMMTEIAAIFERAIPAEEGDLFSDIQ